MLEEGADFLETIVRVFMLSSSMAIAKKTVRSAVKSNRFREDERRMAELVEFTGKTLRTPQPVPFGSSIIDTKTGKVLLKALNAVAKEIDPSSHAEVRAIRLASKKLKSISLRGYTLYTTCEPCPMCMSTALWAGLDRVVYGATIEDASKHCRQIHIGSREVAERSDMRCKVEGPILRDECYALFTHPNMLRAFKSWSTRKPRAAV